MTSDKDALIKKAYDLGFKYEKKYKGCSQCVLAAIQDTLGIDDAGFDAVFKSATGLSAGLCATGIGACGALAGGVMAISYKIGRERSDFSDTANVNLKNRQLGLKLYERFIEEYGSGNCHQIQRKIFGRSFNLLEPGEFEAFEEAGAHIDKCPSVVGNGARWAVEIMLDL